MSLLNLLQVPRLVSVLLVLLDPESITACSLTCRQFYNACRPRLLRRVTLRTERSVLDLASLLDTTPNVGQFINQLCINLFHDGRHRSSTIGNWITVIPLILNPYRHLFTRLSTLSLIGLWYEGEKSTMNRIDTVFVNDLSSTFSTIRVFELEKCMVTLSTLFLLVSTFTNIESLHIIEPKRTRNINHLVSPILPSMRNLKHFTLHMDDIPPRSLESNKLLDWLGSTLKASTPLDNVSTGGTTLESIDLVGRL
ncbi:hypothetical protein C8Q75DRAFT_497835 [Abortiporus biennis]|nr:hypothetical protein C8Q75DRAFT_497835 [Abortiporus biennis]